MNKNTYFSGKLLIAMPGMEDFRFLKSVIYLCAHDAQGAMGLVINQVMPDVSFSQLLGQLQPIEGITIPEQSKAFVEVLHGGPVEEARGFLLHSNDYTRPDTVQVDKNIFVTGTLDALRDVALGEGPKDRLFILGYAGWTQGQLDEELQQNAWLVADADPVLVFNPDIDNKWDMAIRALGIDPIMLSSTGGRA